MKSGAVRIATIYAVSGLLWIILSDKILDMLGGALSVSVILFLSSIKGFLYVLITAVILYRLIQKHNSRVEESELQYRSYFEAHPSPMWIYNRRTLNYTAANNAALAKYGYTLDEFKNMTILDIRPKEDIGKVYTAVKELKNHYNDSGIWNHQKKDGSLIRVHITSHVVSVPGKQDHIMIMATEVTPPEKPERQLKRLR